MAIDVCSGLGLAMDRNDQVEAFSLLFNWQPTASIVGRPVTELDCEPERTQLVVVDTAFWLKRLKRRKCR